MEKPLVELLEKGFVEKKGHFGGITHFFLKGKIANFAIITIECDVASNAKGKDKIIPSFEKIIDSINKTTL